MFENLTTIEERHIANSEGAGVAFRSVMSVNVDHYKDSSLELDEATDTFQSILLEKESQSEPLEYKGWYLDHSDIASSNYENKNGNDNRGLKSHCEIMSLPLTSLKVDESNDVSLNLIPKLKVESGPKLQTYLLRYSESTSYAEESTSIDGNDPLAEANDVISTGIIEGSNVPENPYQTGSIFSASRELEDKYLNPVVVLKRLSFSEIGPIQSNRKLANLGGERDGQHSPEVR